MAAKNDTKTTKPKAVPKDKPKAKSKRGPGRPKVIIDWNKVDVYLKAGCTGTGIAGMMGIHKDTLYDACVRDHKTDFSAYAQHKKAEGDDMLRVKQFDMAMKGDRVMAIWLGKQRLGQREKPHDPEQDAANSPKHITFTITEEIIKPDENGKDNRTDGESDQLHGQPESR